MAPACCFVELLEDRTLLTSYIVDTDTDDADDQAGVTDGLISLREAIVAAVTNAAFGDAPAGGSDDSITFAAGLANTMISVGPGYEIGEGELSIDASGLNITLDGGDSDRLFNINNGEDSTTSIAGLILNNGAGSVPPFSGDGGGGAIRIQGSGVTNLTGLTISGNRTFGDGGGISLEGTATLNLSDSTITGNRTEGSISDFNQDGGGLYVGTGTTANLTNVDFIGNSTSLVGSGGQVANYGTLHISGGMVSGGNTIAGNDVDVWEMTGASAGDLVFVHADTGQSPHFLDDTLLTVRANDGTLIDVNDNFMSPPDSAVFGAGVPQDGSVFFEVTGQYDSTVLSYQLYASIVDPAAAIHESEANETAATADPIPTEQLIRGELSSAADVDFFAVTVPEGGGRILVMLDRDPDDDMAIAEARVGIVDQNGTTLLSQDDGGSAVAGGPTIVQTGGTYYVRIIDHGQGTDTDYQFVVKVLQPEDRLHESETNDGAAAADLLPVSRFGQGSIPQTTTPALTAVSGGGILNASGAVLTMTDSVLSHSTANNAGGGLYNAGRATLTRTDVIGNTAGSAGGGLWNGAGAILVVHDESNLIGNTADEGGGIFNRGTASAGGRLAIADGVSVTGNKADDGSGGGILSENGVVTIEGSTISGNTATRSGGGIEMITGIVELRNSSLDGNTALGGGMDAPGDGGGLHVTGRTGQVGHVRIYGGTINNNTAARQGGGLWNNAGNIMVVRDGAVVSGNTASGDDVGDGGGGIFNNGGRLSIGEAAQIINNSADGEMGSGGGIYSTESAVSITSGSLIDGNTAVRSGGGIEMVFGLTTIIDSTVSNNHALGGELAAGDGGGIHISGPSHFPRIDLRNSQVIGNTAARQGGGIWMSAASVALVRIGTIVDVNTASGNAAGDGGGGIYNQGGRLVINSASISNNHAVGTSGSGGGLFIVTGVTTAENATIDINTAAHAGGGVEIVNGHFETRNTHIGGNEAALGGGVHVAGDSHVRVNIFRSTIESNLATSQGGGLWHEAGGIMLIADGSSVIGNQAGSGNAGDGGGGVFNNGGRLAILGSALISNDATGDGGAVLSVGGGVSVDNSTVAHNDATNNGGGIASHGNLVLNNSTVNHNLADADNAGGGTGGGIFNGGTATLRNTLMGGNSISPAFVLNDIAGNTLSGGSRNNLISHAASAGGLMDGVGGNIVGIGGTGFRPIETVVSDLADNGGPTQTYALLAGSVAINAGNNAFTKDASGNPLFRDQRGFGFVRIADGTVDIGAFEVQS